MAAPPEVSQKTCQGDFSRDHGVKTCATTTQTETGTGPVPNVIAFPGGVLTGLSSRTDVLGVTETQSQKGNGDATTTRTATVLSSTVTPISCTADVFGVEFSQDLAVCAQNGAFLRPTPLGPLA